MLDSRLKVAFLRSVVVARVEYSSQGWRWWGGCGLAWLVRGEGEERVVVIMID